MIETPVLIAGGGPVGMTLALELASHGVRSLLVERNASTTRHPKMDLTNGRSMELFRRLGLVDRLRAAGVPADHPFDIVWATSATGQLLHRFAYPSSEQRRAEARERNDGTYTREPPMRVSQIVIEPVLKQAIDAHPLVDVRFGWAFESLCQDADGVTAVIRSSATGEDQRVRAAYLAGCDGGSSAVRTALGIGLEGQLRITNAYMVHFRSRADDVL
ncbi:MAG: FAD-dependent monooxygenase, partial [Solirubrobacteraceae bacterium]